jgi:lambda repressor-like predicted transcriptional regulator
MSNNGGTELMTITKSKDRTSTRDVVSDVLTENIKLYVAIRNAYDQCDPEIQAVVDCMIRIWNNEESTEDERKRAIHTITDAIFPGESVNMLDDCGRLAKRDPHGRNEQMIEEEQTFAQRLSAFLTEKEMTQEQLASAIGVGQSAISNMLNRQCRPQRKTVARIAAALGVEPAELWSSND